MRRTAIFRALCLALLAGTAPAACGGNGAAKPGTVIDAGTEAASMDTGGPGEGTAACLDRPTELLRAPSDRLPCELIPPGLRL